MKKGIAGLVVVLCSVNLRSRIGTIHVIPIDLDVFPQESLGGRNIDELEMKLQWQEQLKAMAHTHWARFPLTTTPERNTFLHGTTFIGQIDESWSW